MVRGVLCLILYARAAFCMLVHTTAHGADVGHGSGFSHFARPTHRAAHTSCLQSAGIVQSLIPLCPCTCCCVLRWQANWKNKLLRMVPLLFH